jgi:hypothetical protein
MATRRETIRIGITDLICSCSPILGDAALAPLRLRVLQESEHQAAGAAPSRHAEHREAWICDGEREKKSERYRRACRHRTGHAAGLGRKAYLSNRATVSWFWLEALPGTAVVARPTMGPRQASPSVLTLRVGTNAVMVGLVPTIQPSASSGACGKVDPRDKPEDDRGMFCWCQNTSASAAPAVDLAAPGTLAGHACSPLHERRLPFI